jgi:Fe-S-cluster containining protein
MRSLPGADVGDRTLVQIVDAALAEAARKSGPWLACRVGCTECCIGPFAITQLDARRLQTGLAELDARDSERAARVRARAWQSLARTAPYFPGDPATGVLAGDDAAVERFLVLTEDEPCPALDPKTGACDLYAARPISCRTFGPPVRIGPEALATCELCFQDVSDAEITACEVEIDPDGLEAALLEELERTTGAYGETIVAFALAG